MLVEDYDMDEKQDVAIITPADSPPEQDLEPLADDCEDIKLYRSERTLTLQPNQSNLASYHPFLISRLKMKHTTHGISLIIEGFRKENKGQYSTSEVTHGEGSHSSSPILKLTSWVGEYCSFRSGTT